MLPVNNGGCIACIRCTLYACIWIGPSIFVFVTMFLSVLLIQLGVGFFFKQRLSRWIVEAISLEYDSKGEGLCSGVRSLIFVLQRIGISHRPL